MKFGTWEKCYAWINLLQASHSFPSGTLYFSAIGETDGKVAKTWPLLGQHRWFQCSAICAVTVVCTGWERREWEKVSEGPSPEPRAEKVPNYDWEFIQVKNGKDGRKHVRSRELGVTWGGLNTSCVRLGVVKDEGIWVDKDQILAC